MDERPDHDNMWAYSQVLLAEAETLNLVGEQPSSMAPASVKQLGVAASGPKTSQQDGAGGVCRNWGSEHGCKYVPRCRFQHPPLGDMATRCWQCSATGHVKMLCPYRQGGPGQSGTLTGGSGMRMEKVKKAKEKEKTKESGTRRALHQMDHHKNLAKTRRMVSQPRTMVALGVKKKDKNHQWRKWQVATMQAILVGWCLQ